MENDNLITIPVEGNGEEPIIKVMGVGGGGCNAVNHMYEQGIENVSFLVCNTDRQALLKSSVPAKLQIGPGLGAGGDPSVSQKYAEEAIEQIDEALSDGTQMLFITAGMGGGTGTGASAPIAEIAKKKGILTVGIVTIPFAFEGPLKIRKAMTGVAKLAEHVDALLVINNEKLVKIYPDFNLMNAFKKADDVVCNAARSIAEIITVPGYINTDFADVRNTLRNGGVAIMNVGRASGEHRITKAIDDALNSPLVNTNDVHGAKRVLLQFYCSTEHAVEMQEIPEIHAFVNEVGNDVEVQWGISLDETMGEEVRVTIIATGYEVSDIPALEEVAGKPTIDDAIQTNYGEPQTTPNEDEQAAVIELDPNATLGDAIHKSASGEPMAIDDTDDGAIIVEDEPETNTPTSPATPEQRRRGFGRWRR